MKHVETQDASIEASLMFQCFIESELPRQTRKIGPMYSHIWHYIEPMYLQSYQCWANFPGLSGMLIYLDENCLNCLRHFCLFY